MATFYGTDRYSIDDKGRIVVPSSMRAVPGRKLPLSTFILVAGIGGGLWLYAEEDWTSPNGMEERLRQMSMGNKAQRAVARALLIGASKVTVDKQGRISIPSSLLGRAGLGKEAVLHGQVGRIEIWSPEAFDESVAPVLENLEANWEEALGDL